jgi:hypothetical protein
MAHVYSGELDERAVFRGFERTLAAPGNDDWIIMESIEPGEQFTVGIIIATAGSGSVEYTLESDTAVMAGTAEGIPWTLGTVSATTQGGSFPSNVTAIRLVNASGTTKMAVRR